MVERAARAAALRVEQFRAAAVGAELGSEKTESLSLRSRITAPAPSPKRIAVERSFLSRIFESVSAPMSMMRR